MSRLFDAYRAAHEQGFVPIFVHDEFDSKTLLDGCLAAGMKVIEYTLRRQDAHKMIPWIREQYPDLYLLAGSTLDNDAILAQMKRRFPQLLTLAELDAMNVDGYVSMIGWSEQSIRKYAPRRVVMPTASTVNEAFFQVGAGAQFAKLQGPDVDLVKRCRGQAAFDYCPILITGGMTPERIPAAADAGAILFATGFDLTLKGEPKNVSSKKVAEVMKKYVQVAQESRAKRWPALANASKLDKQTWLDALPHYHPF
jgi:2-keto-3-deoxy-6-phosphogluconate aldolase